MNKEDIINKNFTSVELDFFGDRQGSLLKAMDEYAKQQAIAFDNWKEKHGWRLLHEDCYIKSEWITQGEGGFDDKAQRANELYNQFIEQQNKVTNG